MAPSFETPDQHASSLPSSQNRSDTNPKAHNGIPHMWNMAHDNPSVKQSLTYSSAYHRTDDYPADKPYTSVNNSVPVTKVRLPYVPSEADRKNGFIDVGTARANVAASTDRPNGTEGKWREKYGHMTVVQQHTAYWDPDQDGVIWPGDTYRGCRNWGWNPFLAFLAMVIIHGNLSVPTCRYYIPDPFFRIFISNMHRNKHGSDSMTYDNEGRFRAQNFEDFFSKYDTDGKGGLTKWELFVAWRGQAMVWDIFGQTATALEWLATWLLVWPESGVLYKEEARGVFDGSYFQKKADEHAARKRGDRRLKLI